MLRIGKLGHLAHVVDDLKAADAWYDDVFSVHRFYHKYLEVPKREASLVAIGDFVMEPMMSSRVPGAEATPLAKFYARFGPRFHSLAWYVDSVPETFEWLRERGLRIAAITGERLNAAPPREAPLFTHPRETFGQLEFAEPGIVDDPRLRPGWSAGYWRDRHPLGIERASHVTVLARDQGRARTFFQHGLHALMIHQQESGPAGKSAYYLVGEDTVIEAATPGSPDSPAGRELDKDGEVIYSVTFKVRDIGQAERYLTGKGLRVQEQDDSSFALNRADALGLVLRFSERGVPGDPRS